MAVTINPVRRPEERRERRQTDMDKLFQALQIANAGMNIAVNYDSFRRRDAADQRAQQQIELQQSQFEETKRAAGVSEEMKERQFREGQRQFGITEKRARDEFAAEQKAEAEKLAAEAAEGAPPPDATPGTKQIFDKIKDPTLRRKAIAEQGFVQDLAKGKKKIGGAYDTFAGTGAVMGSMPFTVTKAQVDAAESQIMASLQSNWKGPMSDTDLKRIGGVMPSVTDTVAQTKAKKKEMLNLLETNAKPTPTLDGFKIPKEAGAPPENPDKKLLEHIMQREPELTEAQALRVLQDLKEQRALQQQRQQGGR